MSSSGKIRLVLLVFVLSASVLFYMYSEQIFSYFNELVYARKVAQLNRNKKNFIESEDVVEVNLNTGGKLLGVVKNVNEKGIVIDLGYGTVSLANRDVKSVYDPVDVNKKWRLIYEWKSKILQGTEDQRKKLQKKTSALEQVLSRIPHAEKEPEEPEITEIEIPFTDPSQIIVNCTFNNRENAKLLVDTGSTVVVISPRLARHMGIDYFNKETVKFMLADKSTVEGVPILLRSIKVGALEEKNVKGAVILNQKDFEGGYDGLLGMSYLRGFHIKIDNEKNVLHLEKK